MSAVTLSEIADLTAARLKVPVAAMRGLARGKPSDVDAARARAARNVVVLLAWRHTQASFRDMALFFGLSVNGTLSQRLGQVIDTAQSWGSGELAADIEAIEQQIDALHERRMAARDRKGVRV